MIRGFLGAVAITGVSVLPVFAQESDGADAVWEALHQHEAVSVMREEGLQYGAEIGESMFPDRIGASWEDIVGRIYDADRMESVARAAFTEALEGEDTAAILAFFSTEPGKNFVQLEIDARRAMLDEQIDQAAKDSAAAAQLDGDPRYDLIEKFVTANDLIEMNVMGGMNSNLAFYQGLASGGAFGSGSDSGQIMADVWSQEPEIRASTTEWVYAFLMLSYKPMSDADVEAYIAFSQTDAGRAANRALFAAYDDLFVDISRALGTAAAQEMSGADL